ncbi:MAG TPA: PEP-CTERM sorting domain-containing protein [Candidatus Saccharimonadales bacterium]|nr:PEP-CTERM sorting domain-containing protein [Candidatus Saccharimonadales bacterium]
MRKILLSAIVACGVLAAVPAMATYTGSLYTTDFITHHVYRTDVVNNICGGLIDLAGQLPGADGIIFNPLDDSRLLIGGQLSNAIYEVGVVPGGYSTFSSQPIVNGSLLLAFKPGDPVPGKPGGVTPEGIILTSGYEGPVPNSLALVGVSSHNVDNRVISGMSMVSGMAVRNSILYASDGNEFGGGRLFTINLATNTGTLLPVAGSTADMHALWLDNYTGHLFAVGGRIIQEIDLDAVGGPAVVRSWDCTSLIPPFPWLDHFDGIHSDDDGNFFAAVNSGPMVYLDLKAATPTPIMLKDFGSGLDDVACGKTPIPEPSTLLLAGMALLGGALLRKRS